MRRYTMSEKRAGEMAVRRMSEKAQEFYNGADPLSVYEYDDEDENEEPVKMYAIGGFLGDKDRMTLEELEELFISLQDEIERLEAESEG